jgi:hypothetical protein
MNRRVGGEFAARCGEDDVARRSQEQRHAQLLFELKHQPADGGLGHAQIRSRCGKAAIQRDRVHCPDMPDSNVKSAWGGSGRPRHDLFHIGIN